jgi:hypothetical protein
MALGQARRAQMAVQAATKDSADLLDFLREFSTPLAVAVGHEGQTSNPGPGAPGLVARAWSAPSPMRGKPMWAPPVAAERETAVPFKPLAIVPLPMAPVDADPAPAAPSAPTARNELLPARPERRRSRLRRSAVVGSSIAVVCGAVSLTILLTEPAGHRGPGPGLVQAPSHVIVDRGPAGHPSARP